MATVNLKINNREITAEAGMTVLEAARANGIYILRSFYASSKPSSIIRLSPSAAVVASTSQRSLYG